MTINNLTPFSGTKPDKDTQTIDDFDTNVQDWVDFSTDLPDDINTFIDELAVEINTFAQNIAGATANVSIYAAGTTYPAGAQVLDPANNYRMYTSQQGSNTDNTPSEDDGTYWRDTFCNTGADTISSAVDITLTSASKQIQVITITSADKFVVLPDATGLPKSTDTFVFFNKGAYRLGVKDASGNFICSIPAYGQCRISLTDNSTTAGVWEASSDADLLMNRIKTICNSNSTISSIDTCKLTPTSVFVAWQGADSDGFCAVITYNGPSISVSNILEFDTNHAGEISVCRMSDTTAIIAYGDADNDGRCSAITYDGINTLTKTHTYEFEDAASLSKIIVGAINEHDSSGRMFVLYIDSVVNYIYCQILNWNGAVISTNTAKAGIRYSAGLNYLSASLISGDSSSAVILASYSESNNLYVKRIVWSGTTLTPHTDANVVGFSVAGVTSSYNTVVSIAANYSVVFCASTDSDVNYKLIAYLLYWNGSTFEKKKFLGIPLIGYAVFTKKAANFVNDGVIFFAYTDITYRDIFLKIKAIGAASSKDCILQIDSSIDVGISSSSGALLCDSVLSENGAVLVYKDTETTYLAAQYVDIG